MPGCIITELVLETRTGKDTYHGNGQEGPLAGWTSSGYLCCVGPSAPEVGIGRVRELGATPDRPVSVLSQR